MPLTESLTFHKHNDIDLEAAQLRKNDVQRRLRRLMIKGLACLVFILVCVVGAPVLALTLNSQQGGR